MNIRTLLARHHLDPRKGLGQNFLLDQAALGAITATAELTLQDHVLEIGAGLGSLTRFLAVSCKKVTAVEIDGRLIPLLNEVIKPFSNVEVVHGDILKLDPGQLNMDDGYVVVANIPYYITSAIIRHLLDSEIRPRCMVLTMQQEVAERICAPAGELSLLALSVQVFGHPSITATIPASAFYPSPKVDSATLKVDLYREPIIRKDVLDLFFKLARMAFSQKRKMLRNTLAAGLHISSKSVEEILIKAGIDPTRRAQTLDLVEWRTLVDEARLYIPGSEKSDFAMQ